MSFDTYRPRVKKDRSMIQISFRTQGTIRNQLNMLFYDNCRNSRPSLVNCYCQYADRHMTLKFIRRVSKRERANRQFVIVKSKLMSVFNASVLLLTMNFVKVVCGSTRLSPRGSTATLTMLWRNSWSITGQMHKNWHQFVKFYPCAPTMHQIPLCGSLLW